MFGRALCQCLHFQDRHEFMECCDCGDDMDPNEEDEHCLGACARCACPGFLPKEDATALEFADAEQRERDGL